MLSPRLFLAAAFLGVAPLASADGGEALPSRIALFGGSSSATTYLPEEFKHHTVLHEQLEAAYPGQKVEVFNFADNGEFIARYLLKGRYSRHVAAMRGKNIDVAIVRCGINDSKRFTPSEYADQLRRFIDLLESDFPGVKVVLETGFYLDYPKHYSSDRNRVLNPYWEANREVAKERGLPLSDVYHTSEKATASGDWDLRIRSQNDRKYPKKPTRIYWETALDEEYGGEVAWFSDVHPNPRGVKLAVETEVALFKTLYPNRLPSGTGRIAAPEAAREQAFFVDWIKTGEDRLVLKKKNPDRLQKATDPAEPLQKAGQ